MGLCDLMLVHHDEAYVATDTQPITVEEHEPMTENQVKQCRADQASRQTACPGN